MAETAEDQLAKQLNGGATPSKPAGGGPGKGKLLVLAAGAVAVIAACCGGGYLAGGMLRHKDAANHEASKDDPIPEETPGEELAHHELKQFIATLDTPRRDRTISATVVFTFPKSQEEAIVKTLKAKEMELASMLTLYLNSRTLEDVSGKNLDRARGELRDKINELLWPNHRPMIKEVLIPSFVVQ
jgi:flagellar basal body-associated protein FliL